MLRYILTRADNSSEELNCVLSAQLDCDLNVPADSLTLLLPDDDALRESADRLSVYDDDREVFTGQVDEAVSVREQSGHTLRLCARSPAALLLDNEAEPITYIYPSNRLMRDRHLLPFGVTECEDERHPLYEFLRVNKGDSHWKVLERYCRRRYGAMPRIQGSRAYLKGYRAEGTVRFGKDGVPILRLRQAYRRCKALSEVIVRLTDGGAYRSPVKNTAPEARGVTRVRYLNAVADGVSLDTAQQMIDNGNAAVRTVTIRCAGALTDVLGKAAVIDGAGGYRVVGFRFRQDEDGAFTTVSLRKEC
ncbi:MAG: hypothetical protein IJ598_10270 [Ruminococcus sp.]|nr:hypothetical protein [Ruminococcus sp.]